MLRKYRSEVASVHYGQYKYVLSTNDNSKGAVARWKMTRLNSPFLVAIPRTALCRGIIMIDLALPVMPPVEIAHFLPERRKWTATLAQVVDIAGRKRSDVRGISAPRWDVPQILYFLLAKYSTSWNGAISFRKVGAPIDFCRNPSTTGIQKSHYPVPGVFCIRVRDILRRCRRAQKRGIGPKRVPKRPQFSVPIEPSVGRFYVDCDPRRNCDVRGGNDPRVQREVRIDCLL